MINRGKPPRDLNLDKFDESAGVFGADTSNNLAIDFYSPFAALGGTVFHVLHYNAGYRLDQVTMDNQDLLWPASSFSRNATISSPNGTLTFLPPESTRFLPTVSLSYGQTFHVDDPRIGTTAIQGGTIVAKARSFQLVASKTVAKEVVVIERRFYLKIQRSPIRSGNQKVMTDEILTCPNFRSLEKEKILSRENPFTPSPI